MAAITETAHILQAHTGIQTEDGNTFHPLTQELVNPA
jgi:hypothetical protein